MSVEKKQISEVVDLTSIDKYLESRGMTHEQVSSSKQEYIKFLAKKSVDFDSRIVPSKLADTFWHAHILHTKQYENDCMKLFGKFMHHTPQGLVCD